VFGGTGEGGHDDLAYAQMSLSEITDLPVKGLAAPDAHLYLWTTNRYLRDSYGIAEAWGFRPSVLLVWAKTPRGIGLGDTFRLTTEYVLFARRGNLPHARIVPTTWFNWPRGRHSEKPGEFYELIESVTPGPYVDLFARTARSGWTVWGDEVAEVPA
jgi:N6-adenosine-specific RNA methylase IME4